MCRGDRLGAATDKNREARVADLKTIGFIGLGTMGQGMAKNLLKGGFAVQGFDISADAVAAGGTAADSPKAAAEGADLAIAMLPNAPHVEGAMTGPGGLFAADSPGRRILNSSTIDPGEAKRLSALAADAGWRYIDCPMGRTAADAVAGTSLFMLGGATEDKAAVRPALDAMGTDVVDCGDVGQASTIKIANNYLSIVAAVTTAEALRFAEAGGVSPEAVFEVVNVTTAMNGHTKMNFPKKVLSGDIAPGFAIDHAHKDLGIAVEAMAREGIPCFTGPAGLKAYDEAKVQGRGGNDWSDIYNLVGEGMKRE